MLACELELLVYRPVTSQQIDFNPVVIERIFLPILEYLFLPVNATIVGSRKVMDTGLDPVHY